MRINTFYNIVIKLLGIYFLKDLITFIAQLIFVVTYRAGQITEVTNNDSSTLVTILGLLYYTLVSFLLIFKSNDIVNFLKLDKGIHEENMSIRVDKAMALNISIIILGGIFLFQPIPAIIKAIISFREYNLAPR
jgi:hypothetical protein